MRGKTLAAKIKKARELLQADDKQMARHLRLSLGDYEAIAGGGRVLPLPSQKTLENRIKRLLDICGINTEQRKQQ